MKEESKNNRLTSICDTDYTSAMQGLAALIVSKIGSGCVPAQIPDLQNPDCVVQDETTNDDGTVSIAPIPRCDQAGGALPCWELKQKADCMPPASPQGVGISITRDQPLSSQTNARYFCDTIAQ